MPGRTTTNVLKRPISIIDLTADSDDDAQPLPKVARHLTTAFREGPRDVFDSDDDEDGSNELMILTQSADDVGSAYVKIGTITGKIVGVQYYDGYASPGESVVVRREPDNQYDNNAIRIDNVAGRQIGHIPRKHASQLAPYMDERSLVVEGVLAGEKSQYDCPIQLRLFGSSEPVARAALEARMKTDKLPIDKKKKEPKPKKPVVIEASGRKKLGLKGSQSNNGCGPDEEGFEDPSARLEDLIQSSEHYRPRQIDEIAEQWGSTEDMLANMPLAAQPRDLEAQLLPYQLQGLAWMLSMENPVLPPRGSSEVVQLWKHSTARANMFTNIATNFTTMQTPVLAKGGILADDMGLGKTLQVISLMIEGGPGTTLIIAPVGVMSNWSQQMERHVKSNKALNVLIHHGSKRKAMKPHEFQGYDVVITTYATMSSEYRSDISKPATGLFSMQWKRIVLDEGHIIRTPATKAAVAACHLQAEARWVLTGTPIINTIRDLYSMLKFVRITGGLERLDIFNSILTRPLASGDENADRLLQTIMRSMCLRRKKDMRFVDLRLPPLTEYVHRVIFRNDEKEKYKALQIEAKGMLHQYRAKRGQNSGNARDSYRHLLEILLRLRQVCCHWKLCGDRVSDLLSLLDSEKVLNLSAEKHRVVLQALLQLNIENSEDCPVCLETLNEPVITACKHAFCIRCITKVIESQGKCPMCRNPITDVEQLVHPAVEGGDVQDADIDVNTKSSKTEALMSILGAVRGDRKSKVVIFSQWTSFLNIIQRQLDEARYTYTRIDGSMSTRERDGAMRALEREPDTRILLASLAVCSVGLNLVAADTVILADSWWAPAIEDQAVDRVHRLGQTRATTVWRLVMEESIEERVLEIQKEKRTLVGKAFKEKAKGEQVKQTRMVDIQRLLG